VGTGGVAFVKGVMELDPSGLRWVRSDVPVEGTNGEINSQRPFVWSPVKTRGSLSGRDARLQTGEHCPNRCSRIHVAGNHDRSFGKGHNHQTSGAWTGSSWATTKEKGGGGTFPRLLKLRNRGLPF